LQLGATYAFGVNNSGTTNSNSSLPTPPAWRLPKSANLTVEVAVCGGSSGGGGSSRSKRHSGYARRDNGATTRRESGDALGGRGDDGGARKDNWRDLNRRAPAAPRFFLTNATGLSGDGAVDQVDPATVPSEGSLGEGDVYELVLDDGLATWTGPAPDGGVLAVEGGEGVLFLIAVWSGDQNMDPTSLPTLGDTTTALPTLGDTTANQALLFSPVYAGAGEYGSEPSYPNYTLWSAQLGFLEPDANGTIPGAPGTMPNFTLYVVETETSGVDVDV
ncbi:hypothetical protein K525DRAFT_245856, partial [Schizophyllum commune Loenen D]